MQLFVYQPGNRNGSYHTIDGFVTVQLLDDSIDSDRLGSDALKFEDSLADASRAQINDVASFLEANGYSKVNEDTAWPTYAIKPAPVKVVAPVKPPAENPAVIEPTVENEKPATQSN